MEFRLSELVFSLRNLSVLCVSCGQLKVTKTARDAENAEVTQRDEQPANRNKGEGITISFAFIVLNYYVVIPGELTLH